MSSVRKTIGRTFSQPHLPDSNDDPQFSQRFVLASGKTAIFKLIYIPAEELEYRTYVLQEINGRDQSALTADSLTDITRTIHLQQFFPAIGRITDAGIEILDGSRRRAGALLRKVGLNILVTENALTTADARQLAADIQTAKEHNLRETGLRLLAMKKSGLNQKEIAERENLSEAKVTRAIQAAMVPSELVQLFPVQSELVHPDYKFLLTTSRMIEKNNFSLSEFVVKINNELKGLEFDGKAPDEIKATILRIIKNQSKFTDDATNYEKQEISYLWSFLDKDKFARKKSKGRMFCYEFNRMPTELQEKLDEVVNDTILKFFDK